MPPKFPATKERTRTPKRSSRRFTPAVAPLIAKTKVPMRSKTSSSDISSLFPLSGWRKPSLCRDDQRFDAGPQRRMNDGGVERTVIDRQLVESPRFLRLGVDSGIGAAHEPKHGGNLPFRPERSEILAGGRRARSAEKCVRKASATRLVASGSFLLRG